MSNPNFYIRPDYVRTGSWVNYHDGTTGLITMPKDYTDWLNLLIGIFLFFFSSGVMAAISSIFFVTNYHRYRRSRRQTAKSGQRTMPASLYHHQQIILRNVDSPTAAAAAFFKLWDPWTAEGRAAWIYAWPLIAVAVTVFLFFLIVMPWVIAFPMFESQGDEVLIRSPHCGFWQPMYDEGSASIESVQTNTTQEAVTYVDTCYHSDSSSVFCDQYLMRRRLPTIKFSAVECPFPDELCLSHEKLPAYKMQTEVIDSDKDLGINQPPDKRVKLQRTTICAPLATANFTKTTKGGLSGEKMTEVYFGKVAQVPDSDYTFAVSNYQSRAGSAYDVRVFWTLADNGSMIDTGYAPISGLRRLDADFTLILFNNNGIAIKGTDGPCSDPFFSATKNSMVKMTDYFLPDDPITAIGCIDQYEIGVLGPRRWSGPMGGLDACSAAVKLGWNLDARQTASMVKLCQALNTAGGIGQVTTGLGDNAVLAKKYPGMFQNFQNPIPNNQWKKEVKYWFDIGLAKLQLGIVAISLGPPDPDLPGLENVLPAISAGRDDIVHEICNSQRVRSLEFKNYNKAGFIALAVLGSLFILLPAPIRWLIGRFLSDQEAVKAWMSYELLNLKQPLESEQTLPLLQIPTPTIQEDDVEVGGTGVADSRGDSLSVPGTVAS